MYLGIDLGTSGVKVLLIDDSQKIIESETSPLTVQRPRSGWSEQDPAEWTSATEAALDRLAQNHATNLAAVKGIGLSGQMHGATLLGDGDRVLRPCILWNDTRSHAQAARMDGDSQFRAVTGNIVFPGFTAPKLLWVRENEPDIFARVTKVLLPKDYLRLWLTGECVSEMSDAAGTSWLDTGARDWSDPLLSATGMSVEQMPRLVEGSAPSGVVRKQLADRWGMGSAVVVAGGAGDNAASAIGMGVVSAGSAFVSLGTSGVLFAATDSYIPSPATAVHTFCHALPDTWHQMGVILSASAAIDWYAGIAGATPSELTAALGEDLQAPGAVTFLPYLSGERTPYNDASVRGAFFGLGHEADQAALTRAVLEGVAFALRDNLVALRSAGTTIDRIIAVGGGSRSRYWLNVIATALDLPVDTPGDGDYGAAFGAARLGIIAAHKADPRDICGSPSITETVSPTVQLSDSFAASYDKFQEFYPLISGSGHAFGSGEV